MDKPLFSSQSRPWHHTDNGFRNPPGSPKRQLARVKYWRFIWRRILKSQTRPNLPSDHCLSREEALHQFKAMEGSDSITWLGHAAFLIRLQGQTILLDPYLADYASPVKGMGPRRFVDPVLTVADFPPIDWLMISHNHYDHLCAKTIAGLRSCVRGQVIVPLGLKRFFLRRGYTRVTELDWHKSHEMDGLTVTALPAVHWSKRTPFDRNRSLWASYALTGGGRRLWFAGDTGYGAVFPDLGRSYGPFDLAMVPIGAYEPRSIMEAHHATPEEAVRIGRDIGARHLVGMHWGTVILTDEPPFEPPDRFRAAANHAGYDKEQAWLMKIGETRLLPEPWPANT